MWWRNGEGKPRQRVTALFHATFRARTVLLSFHGVDFIGMQQVPEDGEQRSANKQTGVERVNKIMAEL